MSNIFSSLFPTPGFYDPMSIIKLTLWFQSYFTPLTFLLPPSRFQTQLLDFSCLSLDHWPRWRSYLLAANPSWFRRETAGGYLRTSSTSSPPSPWLGPALTLGWGMTAVSAGRPSRL